VIQEIARVLKPSGLFFYDTINRTFFSWFTTIKLAQEWKFTRFMPPNLHEWKKFVRPHELISSLQKYHLQNLEVKGMSPRAHPLLSLSLFLQRKRGKITLPEMGERLHFQESKDLSASYMGYALKMPQASQREI
jgi:2-polyprenyl-6-hydroxyphenyl methylase / 3-demethylubiquinone-9 3-methyltransferase